jgi:hypothetical protein
MSEPRFLPTFVRNHNNLAGSKLLLLVNQRDEVFHQSQRTAVKRNPDVVLKQRKPNSTSYERENKFSHLLY